jgi:hypothetical protein
MYLCERCKDAEALPGEKYCHRCKAAFLDEMERVGYLQPIPRRYIDFPFCLADAKESVYYTRRGSLHGAVRRHVRSGRKRHEDNAPAFLAMIRGCPATEAVNLQTASRQGC